MTTSLKLEIKSDSNMNSAESIRARSAPSSPLALIKISTGGLSSKYHLSKSSKSLLLAEIIKSEFLVKLK